MKMLNFQLFGSKSSIDYDIFVFVQKLDTTEENHRTIKELNSYFAEYFKQLEWKHKKVNCNLGIIENCKLVKTFKGTPDEANNSLYHTYNNHLQLYENQILFKYDRTGINNFYFHLKLKRCLRFILSFYSRVLEKREEIKLALKGPFDRRLLAIKKIDFTKNTEFPSKKELKEDIYKVIAFQLAQTIQLSKGRELFTKEDVLQSYPCLERPILRKTIEKEDLMCMNLLLEELVSIGETCMPVMMSLQEEML